MRTAHAQPKQTASPTRPDTLEVGFVPLIDAAPLIAAAEMGYFADEGLDVVLRRQIGWGNVRDKLVYRNLHASHALLGMAPASILGGEGFEAQLTNILSLGAGGNAIVLSRRLTDEGVDSAAALARRAAGRRRPGGAAAAADGRPVLAHVFPCSMHHYLLRDWLAAGGAEPDRDVRLCVLPPPQVAGHTAKGYLDGYCVGEPYGTLAERDGFGRIVAVTTDVLPSHPEKVLAVNRRWLDQNADVAAAMVRAVLRGCRFCDDAASHDRLAEILARPEYLGLPADLLLRSLRIDRWFHPPAARTAGGRIRSSAVEFTFPSATHALWLLRQMRRWGHVGADVDLADAARRSVDTAPYRRAAADAGIDCPPADFPPMPLRGGRQFTQAGESVVAAASV